MSELQTEITKQAVDALIAEAQLTPKPGLVDSLNNGSHNDMDLPLFLLSAQALTDGFSSYVCVGNNHTGTPKNLIAKIRSIGKVAEDKMFSATHGINTHKGANFSFGILLSALGKMIAASETFADNISKHKLTTHQLHALIQYIQAMTVGLLTDDFAQLTPENAQTFGEKLYLEHHIGGIRAEAENGYPSLFATVLPEMLNLQQRGCTDTQIYHQALVRFMSIVDDSNIIKRGGITALASTKQEAANFLAQGGVLQEDYLEQLLALDTQYIANRLSPGGSADLLALAIFIYTLMDKHEA